MNQNDPAHYTIWTSTDDELVETAQWISKHGSTDVETKAAVRLFQQSNRLRNDRQLLLLRSIAVIKAHYAA